MLAYLIIASVFWFNPLISNVDILPDLVGYLLVLKAFSKSSYVYDCANDVCVAAKKMCIVSGVKILSVTLVSSLDPTMSLLLSFGFGIVEAIFGVPFFVNLFKAFSRLVPAEKGEVHALIDGKIKMLTIVAFVSRLVLAILPDLTALSLDNAFAVDESYTYLRFKPLFIGFSVIISLCISLFWLIKYTNFLRKAVTKEFVNSCKVSFLAKTENKSSIFVAKDNMKVIVLSIICAISIFDITWGYKNIDALPDFIFPFAVAISFVWLLIKGRFKIDKAFIALLISLCLYIVTSIFEIRANLRYYEKYSAISMLKVSEAEDMYRTLCILAIVSSALLVVSTICVYLVMKGNARKNIEKNSDLFSHSDINYYLNEFNRRTRKHLVSLLVLSIICAMSYSLLVIFKPFAQWLILVNMVCEVALIIGFIGFCLYVYDEVYKRILIFS